MRLTAGATSGKGSFAWIAVRDPGSVTTIKSREKYLSNRSFSFKTCGEGLSDCHMVALAAHV
jgi:hypothetical protein